MSIDLNHYKKLLIAKEKEILALVESGKESVKPVELDQTSVGRLSRMDAMQVQAMALASKERRTQELTRITAALTRIETEDYGYCVACSEEIAQKRLELDPTALSCIRCASGKSD